MNFVLDSDLLFGLLMVLWRELGRLKVSWVSVNFIKRD